MPGAKLKKRLALLAAALAIGFAAPTASAASEPIVVVDPSPVTWNTMEELVRVDRDGKVVSKKVNFVPYDTTVLGLAESEWKK